MYSLHSVDTRFIREFECNCLCRSCIPSKFPRRSLSHNNINSLLFIVLKTFGVPCNLEFFSSTKDEKTELVNESDFDSDSQRFADC